MAGLSLGLLLTITSSSVNLTFTVDGIVKIIVSETFTVDGIVKSQTPLTFTVDGIVKAFSTPKTFTVDGIIFATSTQTITLDGIVKTLSNLLTFSIDGIVKAQTIKTFTVDGIVLATTIKTFTADAIVETPSIQKTFTADGIIKALTLTTFTSDGIVALRVNMLPNGNFENDTVGASSIPSGWSAYGSAMTYKGVANDYAQDGAKALKFSNATNVDGGIRITLSGFSIGDVITLSLSIKADANVANANAVLDTAQNGGARTSGLTLSGARDERRSVSITLDITGFIIFLGMGSFGSQSGGTVYYDDLLIEVANSTATYFDGNNPNAVWEGTANNSRSYLLSTITSKTFTVDGKIATRVSSTFTTDGIVKILANTKTFTIDGVVKIQTTKTFTVDGIVLATKTKTFTIDAIVETEANIQSFTVDGIVKVLGNKFTYTTDGIVKTLNNTITFTVDGKITYIYTFTVDADIKAREFTEFTVDGVIAPVQYSGPGGKIKGGLYDEDDAPRVLYKPISTIYSNDDIPRLVSDSEDWGIWPA